MMNNDEIYCEDCEFLAEGAPGTCQATCFKYFESLAFYDRFIKCDECIDQEGEDPKIIL